MSCAKSSSASFWTFFALLTISSGDNSSFAWTNGGAVIGVSVGLSTDIVFCSSIGSGDILPVGVKNSVVSSCSSKNFLCLSFCSFVLGDISSPTPNSVIPKNPDCFCSGVCFISSFNSSNEISKGAGSGSGLGYL